MRTGWVKTSISNSEGFWNPKKIERLFPPEDVRLSVHGFFPMVANPSLSGSGSGKVWGRMISAILDRMDEKDFDGGSGFEVPSKCLCF